MAQELRQSTQIKVRIGPFMDKDDAVTPETGITLGAADQAEALKADGAATVDISAATWAAITGADGWYDLTLTTSHTDTVGTLEIIVQDASVCLPVFARFQVIEEAVYDDLYAAAAAGYAGVTELATVDSNVDAILVDTGTTLPATLGTPAGADMSADIAAVKVDTAATLVDTGTTIPAQISGLNDVAATDIVSGGAITTSGGIASSDIKKVNAVTITGDGSGTPFDVA